MYNVSDKYLEAFRKGVTFDRIRGRIWLKSGDILTVDDSFLVRNKLSITRRVCKGALDIGTFNKAEMRISVYDDNAYDNEYAGARIMLVYELAVDKTEGGEYAFESIPLGTFYVDGKQSKRIRNELSLVAYDKASFFDVAIPDSIRNAAYANIYALVSAVCVFCNVGFAYTEEEFLALSNANIVPELKSEQMQSCSDLIMWAAQTVACCAFINNLGVLNMKPYYFAADKKADRTVTAHERISISYSDTRTYLAYITSYSENDIKNYSKLIDYSAETDGPHIKEGAISFPKNPLLSALTAADCDKVNNTYLATAAFPTRYIESKCFVDPAVELMDRLAFTGGTIDVDRRIVSVCTEIQWKYRNPGKLLCSNYEEYTGGVDEASPIALLAADNASGISETVYDWVPPKSQVEKRIDAMENLPSDVYAVKTRDSAFNAVQNDNWGLAELRPYRSAASTGGTFSSGLVLADNNGKTAGNIAFGSGSIAINNMSSDSYSPSLLVLVYDSGVSISNPSLNKTLLNIGFGDKNALVFQWGSAQFEIWQNGDIRAIAPNGKSYKVLTEEIT